MEPQLSHRVADSVATVVIRNPAKRNAMTERMWRALPPLLDALAGDPAVRALVLTGEGGTFCAGADISTLRESAPQAQGLAVRAEEALAAFPKRRWRPCAGTAWAAGATGGRVRPAVRRGVGAVRGDPGEAGVVYPASSTRRLVALTGPATAKYLLFSGELIDAARALRTGLVDEVLPEGELGARVAEFTRLLVSRSQLTQAAAKEFAGGRTDRDAYWTAEARGSGDLAEGVAAFLERRQPSFGWSVPGSAPTSDEPAPAAELLDEVGRAFSGDPAS